VKETEQESERESSLEKRMYVLTERERAYGKQLGLEWERESEREWEWEQQPQNERKWDEQMQAARIEQQQVKETKRKKAQWNERD
jgi:hypothetical protein